MNIETAEALTIGERDEISLAQLVELSGLPEASCASLSNTARCARRSGRGDVDVQRSCTVIVARPPFACATTSNSTRMRCRSCCDLSSGSTRWKRIARVACASRALTPGR